jgi:lysophospholipase L1-like esterase
MAKPPRQSELERLVRYCHPAKILGTTALPGALDERALASLYGVTVESHRAIVAPMLREALEAAGELQPVNVQGPVLALGDSHTDDLGSWAEILDAVLDVPVVNAGLSGDTTTGAYARLHRLPPVMHAFVLLGTNDARRHGAGDILVSHSETRRNLRAIDRALRHRCARTTWITPPPVDERRIRAAPALLAAGVTWRLADVAVKADLVRELQPDAIDLWPAFKADHLGEDGLHPSPAGQRLIARQVLSGC